MSKPMRWFLVIAWMVFIFSLSNGPVIATGQINLVDFVIKKTGHIGEYTILYLLLFHALEKNRWQNAFLLGLIYAFSDELHQLLVPGRTGMLRDVLTFDTLGLLLGALIADQFSRRDKKRWKKR